MRNYIACAAIFAALLFFVFAPSLQPQIVLMTVDEPFQSQKLAGTVVDATGASVMGVLIEDCDSTFKHVKRSAWTDEDGHFALRRGRNGTTHFLRVSRDGFDPMRITVRLRRSAALDLKIQLRVAT